MQRDDIKLLVKKWWDIYEDESLDYKNGAMGEAGKQLGSLISTFTEDGVVNHQCSAPSAA